MNETTLFYKVTMETEAENIYHFLMSEDELMTIKRFLYTVDIGTYVDISIDDKTKYTTFSKITPGP